MGNWSIHIEGVGCHHNGGEPYDAESVAQRCVRDLVLHGHSVTHATVHAGGASIALRYRGPENVKAISRSDGFAELPVLPTVERAERLYQVYCESSGGKNFRGDPCPAWAELPEAIRGHWTAVAKAAAL